ncbi:MAG: hemin uptake protein HemP [Sulfuritalea sp.]|jgi:hemin uptake protein HemP|nr:hemin uptake protein HemP [Sulfuritalea sp.]
MKTEPQQSASKPDNSQQSMMARRPLDSATLLGRHDEVEIAHHGEIYRLRRTRQGKLILTK